MLFYNCRLKYKLFDKFSSIEPYWEKKPLNYNKIFKPIYVKCLKKIKHKTQTEENYLVWVGKFDYII